MEDNDKEGEQMDFSVIECNQHRHKQFDSSVQSLLTINGNGHQTDSPNEQLPSMKKQLRDLQNLDNGSFMRDLGKLEKQISYQSVVYNIYESSEIPAEITRTIQGKQQSTCTKTMNNIHNVTNATKGTSNILQPDFRHLILDFHNQPDHSQIKLKQNYANYFGTLHVVRNKHTQTHKSTSRSGIKSNRKLSTEVPFSIKNQLHKNRNKNINHGQNIPKNTHYQQKDRDLHKTKKSKIMRTQQSKRSSSSDYNKTKIKGFNSKSKNKYPYISMIGRPEKSSAQKTMKNNRFTKKPQKKKQNKTKNNINQAIYSEYFGFSNEERPQSELYKHNKGQSRSKSKSKKIIVSKRDMQISHLK